MMVWMVWCVLTVHGRAEETAEPNPALSTKAAKGSTPAGEAVQRRHTCSRPGLTRRQPLRDARGAGCRRGARRSGFDSHCQRRPVTGQRASERAEGEQEEVVV